MEKQAVITKTRYRRRHEDKPESLSLTGKPEHVEEAPQQTSVEKQAVITETDSPRPPEDKPEPLSLTGKPVLAEEAPQQTSVKKQAATTETDSPRRRARKPRPLPLTSNPEQLKKALALMTETLGTAADEDVTANAAITVMLEAVGDFLGVSRVYVMLDEKDGRYLRNTHEWVNHGTGPAMSSWPLHDYERDLPSLKPLLRAKLFLAAHSKDLPSDLERTLHKQGVESVLLVPLLRDGRWIGVTGCDNCGKRRRWNEVEILLMRHLAQTVMFTLERGERADLRYALDRVRQALEGGAQEKPDEVRPPRAAETEAVTLNEAERRLISECLHRCRGNKQRAAAQLGLTWAALNRRCKKLNIEIFKG